MTHPIYDADVVTLDGEARDLSEYRGKLLLIVNTASKCGFTPQYAGLEELHKRFAERGLVILGFPCNQFGRQEPGSSEEISSFCQRRYGVSFPMHEKIEVNGAGAHPLYQHLKAQAPGVLGTQAVKWNFTKFLVDRDGNVVKRYGSRTRPEALVADLERLL